MKTISKTLAYLTAFLALSMIALPTIMMTSRGTNGVADTTGSPFKTSMIARVQVSDLPPADGSPTTTQAPWPSVSNTLHATSSASSPSGHPIRPLSSGPFTQSSSIIGIQYSVDALNQIQSCGCTPPDVQVAAGPNHVVEMVNLEGLILSKTGTVIQRFALTSFWGVSSLSDPKIQYDATSGRWFTSIIAVNNNQVLFAASASNDPTGTWNQYSVSPPAGVALPDQPILGINDDKVVLSVNDFNQTSLMGAQYWVINKSEMAAGSSPLDLVSFGPMATQASVHPVQSLSSTTTEYMVSSGVGNATSGNKVVLFSITGTPPGTVSVTTTSISVSGYLKAIGSVQPGTTNLLGNPNQNDQRIQDAAWFQGKLWLGFNTACTPSGDTQQRACIRLSQINTSSNALLQDFNFSISGQYVFYPALRIEGQGNLDVIYGFSSSTIYPSLAVTGQLTTDPANSLAAPKTMKSGSYFEGSVRYGDYFGAGVDPSDTSLVWVAGEYHTADTGFCVFGGCWSTYIGSISMKPDYAVSAPNSAFAAGASGSVPITVSSIHGGSGSISLTVSVTPSGPTVSLSPTSLSLNGGGTASSTLTFSTTSSATHQLYAVNVTGTLGSLVHSAIITVAVTSISWTVSNSTTFTGVTVTTNGTLTMNSPANSLIITGSMSVLAKNSTTGSTLFSKTYSVTNVPLITSAPRSAQAKLILDILLSIPLGSNLLLSLSGATTGVSYGVSRNYDINQDGQVNGPDTTILGAAYGCSIGQQCYNPKADVNADGNVTIVDAAAVAFFWLALDFMPKFSISANPTSLALTVGTQGTSTFTVTSLNGFSGTVSLSLSVTPLGSTASLNTTSVTLTSGSSKGVKLTISSSTNNAYTANVTATSGVLAHAATVAVSVPDFNMTTPNPDQKANIGANAYYTLTFTWLGPFTGSFSLSLTNDHGSTATLSSTTVTISNVGGIAYALLSFKGNSYGIFTASVTATSGSLVHSVSVSVCTEGIHCPLVRIVPAGPLTKQSVANTASTNSEVSQNLAFQIASLDTTKRDQ